MKTTLRFLAGMAFALVMAAQAVSVLRFGPSAWPVARPLAHGQPRLVISQTRLRSKHAARFASGEARPAA